MYMRKAVIHIGAHKTGSTPIQIALYRNAMSLYSDGICYPLNLTQKNDFTLYGQHSVSFFLQGDPYAAKCCENPDNIVYTLQNAPRDMHLLLSSETFILLSRDKVALLKEYLDGYDIEIVLYVRRQDESAQALFQTEVVHYGVSQNFDQYFSQNAHKFDYRTIANTWADVIGKKKIHIRRYERDSFPKRDVVKDFVSVLDSLLGINIGGKLTAKPSFVINRGLPRHVVSMINYYNSQPGCKDVVKAITDFSYGVYEKPLGQYEIIPPSQRRKILDHYRDGNRELCENYLGCGKGEELFTDLTISQTDEQWKAMNRPGNNLATLLIDAMTKMTMPGQGNAAAVSVPVQKPDTTPNWEPYRSLHKHAAKLSPREWAELVAKSTEAPVSLGGITLPTAPPPVIQSVFSNDSGTGAIIRTAFPVYEYAMQHVRRQKITPNRLLDFGCGWGRITRLFLHDVPESGLFGVDPWGEAVQLARTHMPFAAFLKTEADPPLPFVDDFFDVIFSNSVFSHLSYSSARDWGKELTRVLRPGGILVATTLHRAFLDTLEGIKSGKLPSNRAWGPEINAKGLANVDIRPRYERGEFVYVDSHGTGENGKYGLAFLPEALIKKEWTGMSIVEYLSDPPQGLQQAIFVLRKK
jgi:SAM-dependent methyltransferase